MSRVVSVQQEPNGTGTDTRAREEAGSCVLEREHPELVLAARNKIRTTCGNPSTVAACTTLVSQGKIAIERGVATTFWVGAGRQYGVLL